MSFRVSCFAQRKTTGFWFLFAAAILNILKLDQEHRLISYKDTKMSSSNKIYLERDYAASVYLSEAPPLLGFCVGWSRNVVVSESGQMQNVKLLQNMVTIRNEHPPPLPSHTFSVYTVLWHKEWGRREESWTRERLEGQQFTKLGWKYQHDWLFLQSI
jgi:hypothetical protein